MDKKDEELKDEELKDKKRKRDCFDNMRKTMVWLDLENCRVPHDLNPEEVYPRMKKTLEENGYGGELDVEIVMPFTDDEVPSGLLKTMRLFRVKEYPRPKSPSDPEKKDNQIVDNHINGDIERWLSENPEPHNVLIPSGDGDFEKIARRVKEAGHTFLMAYDGNRTGKDQKRDSSEKMQKIAERAWIWRDLLRLPKSQSNKDLRFDNKLLHKEFLKKNRGADGSVDGELYENFKKMLAERTRQCIEVKEGDLSFSQELTKLKREALEREKLRMKDKGFTDEEIEFLKLKVPLEPKIYEELVAKHKKEGELRRSRINAGVEIRDQEAATGGIVVSEGNVEELPVEQKGKKRKGKEKAVDEEDDKEFAERSTKIGREMTKKIQGPGGSDI